MHSREDVELALMALEEGWTRAAAGALVGASGPTVSRWAAGRVPHERRGAARGRGRMAPRGVPRGGSRERVREGGPRGRDDREHAAQGGVGRPKRGRLAPGFDINRRKCGLGERLRAATGLPLREITAFLRISRSSHGYHRARLGRDKYAALRREVGDLFRSLGGGRGYRAVHAELRRRGVRVSEKVVRRLMREQGLSARRRRRRAWSSYAGEASPAPPNLPLRPDGTHDFSAPAPNRLWATDITEFRLPSDEKAYLSVVLDCFDGRPAGWSVGPRPTAALANSSWRPRAPPSPPASAPSSTPTAAATTAGPAGSRSAGATGS